jgi:hypothetical protein
MLARGEGLGALNLSAKDGVPGDIYALAQTTDGFLWLGTMHGLCRQSSRRCLDAGGLPFPRACMLVFCRVDSDRTIAQFAHTAWVRKTGRRVLLQRWHEPRTGIFGWEVPKVCIKKLDAYKDSVAL